MTSALHRGQLLLSLSHPNAHSWWKLCWQGRLTARLDQSSPSQHTEHRHSSPRHRPLHSLRSCYSLSPFETDPIRSPSSRSCSQVMPSTSMSSSSKWPSNCMAATLSLTDSTKTGLFLLSCSYSSLSRSRFILRSLLSISLASSSPNRSSSLSLSLSSSILRSIPIASSSACLLHCSRAKSVSYSITDYQVIMLLDQSIYKLTNSPDAVLVVNPYHCLSFHFSHTRLLISSTCPSIRECSLPLPIKVFPLLQNRFCCLYPGKLQFYTFLGQPSLSLTVNLPFIEQCKPKELGLYRIIPLSVSLLSIVEPGLQRNSANLLLFDQAQNVVIGQLGIEQDWVVQQACPGKAAAFQQGGKQVQLLDRTGLQSVSLQIPDNSLILKYVQAGEYCIVALRESQCQIQVRRKSDMLLIAQFSTPLLVHDFTYVCGQRVLALVSYPFRLMQLDLRQRAVAPLPDTDCGWPLQRMRESVFVGWSWQSGELKIVRLIDCCNKLKSLFLASKLTRTSSLRFTSAALS